jgi:hypothetical protein
MWLLIPGISSLSAPELEDSTSASAPPVFQLARSATWNGKSISPSSWRRVWRTASWTALLSGAICDPSMAERGAARWIAFARASRANRTPSPAGGAGPGTPGGSGRKSGGSLATWSPDGSSWKTCQGSLPLEGLIPSSPIWPKAGGLRNGAVFRRPATEPRTAGSGSSSWRTVNTRDHHPPGPRPDPRCGQAAQVYQAQNWPTPTGHEAGTLNRSGAGGPPQNLAVTARHWPTPRVMPGTHSKVNGKRYETSLEYVSRASLPDPPTGPPGSASSPPDPTSPPPCRLNPAFVEWLMGFSEGWTVPEPGSVRTGCGRLATPSCPPPPPAPSASFLRGSTTAISDAPPEASA